MTALEVAARREWIAWGAHAKWTFCHACNEWAYCRSRSGTFYLCLGCFDQG